MERIEKVLGDFINMCEKFKKAFSEKTYFFIELFQEDDYINSNEIISVEDDHFVVKSLTKNSEEIVPFSAIKNARFDFKKAD